MTAPARFSNLEAFAALIQSGVEPREASRRVNLRRGDEPLAVPPTSLLCEQIAQVRNDLVSVRAFFDLDPSERTPDAWSDARTGLALAVEHLRALARSVR